jgi:hypothetical protein
MNPASPPAVIKNIFIIATEGGRLASVDEEVDSGFIVRGRWKGDFASREV